MILNYYWTDEEKKDDPSTKFYLIEDDFKEKLVSVERNGEIIIISLDDQTTYIDSIDHKGISKLKNFLERNIIQISEKYWFQAINFKAQLPNNKILWLTNIHNEQIAFAYVYKADGTVIFNTFTNLQEGCKSLNAMRRNLIQ